MRTLLDQGEVTNAKGRRGEVKEFCLGRRRKKNGTTTEAAEYIFFVEDSVVRLYSNYEMDIFLRNGICQLKKKITQRKFAF